MRDIKDDDEEWNDIVRKQMESKRAEIKGGNDLREMELQLNRERFEEEKAEREEARKNNAKQLEIILTLINKQN